LLLKQRNRAGVAAVPDLTIQYFDELLASKGIVLMRGEIIDPRVLSMAEAQMLINHLQIFYLDDKKYEYIHNFNHRPDLFRFEDIPNIM